MINVSTGGFAIDIYGTLVGLYVPVPIVSGINSRSHRPPTHVAANQQYSVCEMGLSGNDRWNMLAAIVYLASSLSCLLIDLPQFILFLIVFANIPYGPFNGNDAVTAMCIIGMMHLGLKFVAFITYFSTNFKLKWRNNGDRVEFSSKCITVYVMILALLMFAVFVICCTQVNVLWTVPIGKAVVVFAIIIPAIYIFGLFCFLIPCIALLKIFC
jgi:hypothetical protein